MAEKTLATVGGIAITDRDVNEFIAGLGQRVGSLPVSDISFDDIVKRSE